MDEIDKLFSALSEPKKLKKKRTSDVVQTVDVRNATSAADIKEEIFGAGSGAPGISTAHDMLALLPVAEPSVQAPPAVEKRTLKASAKETPQCLDVLPCDASLPLATSAAATLYGSRLLHDMFGRVPAETVATRLNRPLLLNVSRDRG